MRTLMQARDEDIPASYWLAATVATVALVIIFVTTFWFPRFGFDWATTFLGNGPYGLAAWFTLVFGLALGLGISAAAWIALRWGWVGLGLALVPVVPSLLDSTPLHFGVIAGLGAVALTAGWRSAPASIAAVVSAAAVVVVWLSSGREMAAPFRATIDVGFYSTGRLVQLGALYLVVLALVLAGAAWLKHGTVRSLEHQRLASRSEEVEMQAAVVGERARLARDLHDVVAHHVSLIAVRAETAPYTNPDLEAPARAVLADIAADARLALDELRGVLGILGRADGDAERSPQPGWQEITSLVERARTAGAEVVLDGPSTADVGAAPGYAAYRVVQEALTNARKHAPGLPVRITLAAAGQLVVVRVATSGTPASGTPGAGHGLVGMRERVEGLGGRLVVGPVGTEFVVEATLPREAR